MRDIISNVSDEDAESPQQKKQRVDEDGKEKNESSKHRFGLFTGIFGAPRYAMPSMGFNFAAASNSSAGENAGYGGLKTKVGEQVMIDMHRTGTMGMQRSMKEAAEVTKFNQAAVVKHAFRPTSISMMIQSLLFMNKQRLMRLDQQDISIEDKALFCASLMMDLDASFQLTACGLTYCRSETIGMVISRALMLDQDHKEKTYDISNLLKEAGMLSAIHQAHSNSNTVYGGYKRTKNNKRKEKGVCFLFRDNGSCRFGNKCRYSHDLSANENKKEEKK